MRNSSNYNNSPYRYTLEPGSKKHPCPNCHKKRFVRYIDTETGDYLPEQYGRCDREVECSYHCNPYTDGYAKTVWQQEREVTGITKSTPIKKYFFCPKPKPSRALACIPAEVLKQTLTSYEKNTFIQNLLSTVPYPFTVDAVTQVIECYRLGTITGTYMTGAVTFPFIDLNHKIRAIQVKQFDPSNHTTKTSFLHSIIEKNYTRNNKPLPDWLEAYNKNEKKVSCLFGEHLLRRHPHNPVALVEAPKTAIYGTLYLGFPNQPTNLLWLAVYNLSSLTLNKCKALKGRNVYLFPDLSKDGKAFALWSDKAKHIQKQVKGTYFTVSDLLERLAPEQDREDGKDLADYLIRLDWRLFRKQHLSKPVQPTPKAVQFKRECQKTKPPLPVTPLPNVEVFDPEPFAPFEKKPSKDWTEAITVLEDFFAKAELPNEPIQISPGETVADLPLFIESHLDTVKAQNGNPIYLPYLHRLQQLQQQLTPKLKLI